MIKCNLKTVRAHAINRNEFNCNGTLAGKWEHHPSFGRLNESVELANHLLGSCNNFVIYSYNTPIAVYNLKGWWKNPNKYSVTTSRHMSAIGV